MATTACLLFLTTLLPLLFAQQIGTITPEIHPQLTTWKCTTAGDCTAQNTSVVLEYQAHWIHNSDNASCTTSSGINTTICPDEATCAANCMVEGANYTRAGVTTNGDSLHLTQYVTAANGNISNASPRVYLLDADGDYEILQLNNQELRFDVDVSTLVCGENGALYLSEMDATGGRSADNPAGANYGAGYCDAQCPVLPFRNGSINYNSTGYCCNEMDIWEANANATAYTPHPCVGDTCDKGGCGFNPYTQGNQMFYGNGGTVDTLKPLSVITQFYTSNNQSDGNLIEIRRLYIQNGNIIQNAVSTSTGLNSITADWCNSTDASAASLGGLTTMGKALERGMTLVFSIWNDNEQFMNWLDSASNGPCSATEGDPALIQKQTPGTYVTFSNIRWGDIGSTYEVTPTNWTSPSLNSTLKFMRN